MGVLGIRVWEKVIKVVRGCFSKGNNIDVWELGGER